VGLALGVVMLVSLSAYLIVSHNHDTGISLLFLDRQLHPVSGVRVELYAFYPTSTGTVFTQVFNEYTSSSSVTLPLQAWARPRPPGSTSVLILLNHHS